MAYIKTLKDNELIGGQDNSDVYPISTTQAIFSQLPDGSLPPGVRHQRLEDRLQDFESDINDIRDIVEQLMGGNVITIVLSTNSVTYGIPNNVTIVVQSAKVAESIKIYRSGSVEPIFTASGTDEVTFHDSVLPSSTADIIYQAEVKVMGLSKTVNKSVAVLPGEAPLSWSKGSDTVNVNEESHVYPVLNNPDALYVTYSSTNASVASIDTSTGVITLHNIAGTAKIQATFAGDGRYAAKTVEYTLTVTTEIDYYINWYNCSKAAFAAKTTEELLDNALQFTRNSANYVHQCEDIVFCILFREGHTPTGELNSQGFISTLSKSDFEAGGDCPHTPVTIDGAVFKVYGTRNLDLPTAGNIITIDFQ